MADLSISYGNEIPLVRLRFKEIPVSSGNNKVDYSKGNIIFDSEFAFLTDRRLGVLNALKKISWRAGFGKGKDDNILLTKDLKIEIEAASFNELILPLKQFVKIWIEVFAYRVSQVLFSGENIDDENTLQKYKQFEGEGSPIFSGSTDYTLNIEITSKSEEDALSAPVPVDEASKIDLAKSSGTGAGRGIKTKSDLIHAWLTAYKNNSGEVNDFQFRTSLYGGTIYNFSQVKGFDDKLGDKKSGHNFLALFDSDTSTTTDDVLFGQAAAWSGSSTIISKDHLEKIAAFEKNLNDEASKDYDKWIKNAVANKGGWLKRSYHNYLLILGKRWGLTFATGLPDKGRRLKRTEVAGATPHANAVKQADKKFDVGGGNINERNRIPPKTIIVFPTPSKEVKDTRVDTILYYKAPFDTQFNRALRVERISWNMVKTKHPISGGTAKKVLGGDIKDFKSKGINAKAGYVQYPYTRGTQELKVFVRESAGYGLIDATSDPTRLESIFNIFSEGKYNTATPSQKEDIKQEAFSVLTNRKDRLAKLISSKDVFFVFTSTPVVTPGNSTDAALARNINPPTFNTGNPTKSTYNLTIELSIINPDLDVGDRIIIQSGMVSDFAVINDPELLPDTIEYLDRSVSPHNFVHIVYEIREVYHSFNGDRPITQILARSDFDNLPIVRRPRKIAPSTPTLANNDYAEVKEKSLCIQGSKIYTALDCDFTRRGTLMDVNINDNSG